MFPNVRVAETAEEIGALQRRYETARHYAVANGSESVFRDFEVHVGGSKAVMACSLSKLLPLANGHTHLYPSYSEWLNLRFTFDPEPGAENWHLLRGLAEQALLAGRKDSPLHYAALTTDGMSAPGYGECHITLADHMVSHRATTFEGNSATLLRDWNYKLAPGYWTVWNERRKHACAKLGGELTNSTKTAEFSRILLKPGPTALDHEFIEVNIYGPMTVNTFGKARIVETPSGKGSSRRPRARRGRALPAAIRELFEKANVPVEFV